VLDHIVIRVSDLATSRHFYERALAPLGMGVLGERRPRRAPCRGTGQRVDNGGPGVREICHPQYYGASVLDPNGHNVEAVCHDASG
jgi:hypothetical protein